MHVLKYKNINFSSIIKKITKNCFYISRISRFERWANVNANSKGVWWTHTRSAAHCSMRTSSAEVCCAQEEAAAAAAVGASGTLTRQNRREPSYEPLRAARRLRRAACARHRAARGRRRCRSQTRGSARRRRARVTVRMAVIIKYKNNKTKNFSRIS